MKAVLTAILVTICLGGGLAGGLARPAAAQIAYEMTPEQQALYDRADRLAGEGDMAGAEAALRTLVADLHKVLPETRPELLAREGDIASMIAAQGRRGEALEMRWEILEKFRKSSTIYHPLHTIAQMDLAVALAESGDLRGALPLAIEAVTVAETIHGADGFVANVWRGQLAGMMVQMGLHDDAAELYAKSIASLDRVIAAGGEAENGGLRSAVTSFAGKLAEIYRETGRFDAAVVAETDAVVRNRRRFGPEHGETIAHELLLAGDLLNAGEVQRMHELLEEMMPRIEAAYGRESPAEALALSLDALWWLGKEFRSDGFMHGVDMLRRADAMFDTALPTPRGEGFRHVGWGRALLNLSAVLEDLEDWSGSAEAALKAESLGMGSRGMLMRALDNAGYHEAWPWGRVIPEAFRVAQLSASTGAGQALEQMAARVSLGDSPAARLHRAITDANDTETALQAEYAALLRQPLDSRDARREKDLKVQLSEVSLTQKRLTDELHATGADFAALINDGQVGVDELKALLGPEDAAILFDIGERDGDFDFVFVITAETAWWMPMPVDPSQLAAAVADIRASVDMQLGVRGALALKAAEREKAAEFNFAAAHWLYQQTFAGIEELIADKPHLYVELRGPLTAIPPQLLLRNPATSLEEADWLARHHSVTVVPSLFALKAMEVVDGRARAEDALFGVANPDFDPEGKAPVQVSASNRGGTLAPLPETADELRSVAASMGEGGKVLLEQGEASEAAVKAADLSRARVLYFATHGLVAGDEVKDSVVAEPALALTPGGGEDGLLTASEIALLKLNADWVVLSACNTAVGNTPEAEALSGLAQSFIYAGARALLVSHWPVESQSAVALMTDIFARRAADPGLSAAGAQRQAMLALIDGAGRPEWRHPAYWAPFILVGDPDR